MKRLLFFVLTIPMLFSCNNRNSSGEQKRISPLENDSILVLEQPEDTSQLVSFDSIAQIDQARQDSIEADNRKKQEALDQMLNILANLPNKARQKYKDYSFTINDYIKSLEYFTSDYDKDGIPELWIQGGMYFAECSPVEVYKLNSKGKVVMIKEFCLDGGFYMKNGIVYSLDMYGTGDDADWALVKYNFKGDKLTETEFDGGNISPEEPNYKPTPSIKYIKQYPITNTSHLKQSFKFTNIDN